MLDESVAALMRSESKAAMGGDKSVICWYGDETRYKVSGNERYGDRQNVNQIG